MFIDVFHRLCEENDKKANRVMADCGFSNATYSGWKNRGTIPNGTFLVILADYFNVSVDYLLERTDVREMAGSSSELERLNAQLDEVGRARLLAYADDLVSSGKYKKGTINKVG